MLGLLVLALLQLTPALLAALRARALHLALRRRGAPGPLLANISPLPRGLRGPPGAAGLVQLRHPLDAAPSPLPRLRPGALPLPRRRPAVTLPEERGVLTRPLPLLPHAWNLDPSAAIALQRELAANVIRETTFETLTTVAGIDASYRDGVAYAAAVVLS